MTDSAMRLFKIVTDRDDIIVGFSEAALSEMGGLDAGAIGRTLVTKGELSAWQYNVGRRDGNLVQVATQKVSLLAHSSVRVEPYQAAFPVLPPG